MGYYIDLSLISIDKYKSKLMTGYLLPSRIILKENIEARFAFFKDQGIQSVAELQLTLKKKSKFTEFTRNNLFTEEYLSILHREINSLLPKPNIIASLPGIDQEVSSKLEKAGYKTTLSVFNKITDPAKRKALATETGIDEKIILELTKLTDLSRIRWVGSTFARVLFETGYDTVQKIASADYIRLHEKINLINKEKGLFKGKIGQNDIKLCVEAAKDVSLDIKY